MRWSMIREINIDVRSDYQVCCGAAEGKVYQELDDMKVNQQPSVCFCAHYGPKIDT
jgi:hypothetical protein